MARLSSVPAHLAGAFAKARAEGRLQEVGVNGVALTIGNKTVIGHRSIAMPGPPPAGCSERVFQDHVRLLFVWGGWLFHHAFDSRRTDDGFPDCVAGRGAGQLVVAELKVGKARPTKAQERWLAFFRTVPGARVYVWRPADWSEMVEVLT